MWQKWPAADVYYKRAAGCKANGDVMTDHNLGTFIRQLARTLLDDARTDGELLAAFALDRNEDAFLILLGRHAQTVWSVCRNTLTDAADAEDAFQATFMALAAKATELHRRDQLEPWLRTTARFAARVLRRNTARRNRRLQVAGEMGVGTETSPVDLPDWSAVQEEFQALPEDLRRVLSLYYLEGRTFAEISEQLDCSITTTRRRVTQAAESLRRRLRARGITSVAGGVLAGIFAGETTALAMAPDFVQETVGLAKGFASGIIPPSPAGALAAELIARKSAFWLVIAAAVLVFAGGVVGAASLIPRAEPLNPLPQPVATAPAPVPTLVEAPPLAVLKGVVRDEAGRLVPGARVAALAHFARFGQGGIRDEVLGSVTADGEGRFTLPVPHFPVAVAEARQVKLLVNTPDGKTLTTAVSLPTSGEVAPLDLRVTAAQTVQGVVVDSTGKPVPKAVVRLIAAGEVSVVPLAGEFEPNVQGWPTSVRTNAQGQFKLEGVPAKRAIRIVVEHEELAYQEFFIREVLGGPSPEVRLQLGKVRFMSGRVLAADTKTPVGDALISVLGRGPGGAVYGRNVRVGADGTFRFTPPAERFVSLRVHPPQGSTLLAIAHDFEWPVDQAAKQWDAVLPRGVVVRGRVTEHGTGAPVQDALVSFNPEERPPGKAQQDLAHVLVGTSTLVATDKDGRFILTVPPEKGTLVVEGPSLAYLSEVTDKPITSYDGVAQVSRSVHAAAPLDVSDGNSPAESTVTLCRGVVMPGRAVLPDGLPVKLGAVVCRHLTNPRELFHPVALPIRDGQFEIPGCRSGYEYSVLLVTDDFKHGAVARLKCSGKDAAPVTITLQPSSRCSVEMRSPSDTPDVGIPVALTVALEPEGPAGEKTVGKVTQIPYSHAFIEMRSLFPMQGPPDWIETNRNGLAVFEGLIPGAAHHVWLTGPKGEKLGVELRVPTGQEKRVSAKRTWSVPEKK